MPALLAGQEPNVFLLSFVGALMDLGIYPIYAAVRPFDAMLITPLNSKYYRFKWDKEAWPIQTLKWLSKLEKYQ